MEKVERKVRRVVVIDDSRTSQAFIEAAFENQPDFKIVAVASDATLGIDYVRRLGPDLVTIDLCMPYIDGAELLAMMAAMSHVCKLVISEQVVQSIAVSSKLEALGATQCLGKRELSDDPRGFFRKVVKACERVEQANAAPVEMTLSSDSARRTGARWALDPVHYGFPVPADEDARLELLHRKGLGNAVRERQFDLITRFGAEITGFPVCLMTFIDRDTQWIKSAFGFDAEHGPRADAFCNYTIAGGTLFVIPNAETDPRFRDNPCVVGEPGFRTYAGQPILSDDGVRLGAMCVLDTRVRPVTPTVRRQLATMAEILGGIIDSRVPTAA